MEYFNTGIPCQHQFSLALRKNLKILFSERWFLEFERLAVKHPEKLHSSRIQNYKEQRYVYRAMVTVVDKDDSDKLGISKENIRIGHPCLQVEADADFDQNGI